MIRTISITPTWEGVLPMLVEIAIHGTTPTARNEAMGELRRMAQLADKYVEESKPAAHQPSTSD